MTAPSPMPSDRRRLDHPRTKAFNRAMVVVVLSFVAGFAAFAGMAMAGVEHDRPIPQAIGKGIALLCAGSIVVSLWMYVSLRTHRCPRCGAKTAAVDEAYPAINKFCAACNVEWVTGLAESQSLD